MRIRALFWDVGGVLLTNGWDRASRQEAADRFGLDPSELEERHQLVMAAFEAGRLSLAEYLEQTVFHSKRPFTLAQFKEFMLSRSQPDLEALQVAQEYAGSGTYLMATLNNESRELNEHRIHTFGLRRLFQVFVSSCYVGYRKPEAEIYRMALDLTQQEPHACLFIDDRPLNLECAGLCGMNALLYRGVEPLRRDLGRWGVKPG